MLSCQNWSSNLLVYDSKTFHVVLRFRQQLGKRVLEGDPLIGCLEPFPPKKSDNVRHGADNETFCYVGADGERVSVVYEYATLKKFTGKTRHELDFPVLCSTRRCVAHSCSTCQQHGKFKHREYNKCF